MAPELGMPSHREGNRRSDPRTERLRPPVRASRIAMPRLGERMLEAVSGGRFHRFMTGVRRLVALAPVL